MTLPEGWLHQPILESGYLVNTCHWPLEECLLSLFILLAF